MIFIGDLYQLPPVVTGAEKQAFADLYPTPYFYSARVFDSLEMEFVELEKFTASMTKSLLTCSTLSAIGLLLKMA